MGEDTEHELSLSRHDDSDMSEDESVIYPAHHRQYFEPLEENEEAKQEAGAHSNSVAPVHIAGSDSDSESLVDSSEGEIDQSVVDAEFLRRDEESRLHAMLDKKRRPGNRLPGNHNSKV